MRVLRTEVRAHTSPELNMPQFRTLAFLGRNEGAMLGDVAAFLTLSLSAASKLVDGLVSANLIDRDSDPSDRRKVVLKLTPSGRLKFDEARRITAEFIAERVAPLSHAERACIIEAMGILQRVFANVPPETAGQAAKNSRAKLPA